MRKHAQCIDLGPSRQQGGCTGMVNEDEGGEKMEEHMEMVRYGQASTEELVQVLVGLIRDSPELRRAILEVVWACPNARMQV